MADLTDLFSVDTPVSIPLENPLTFEPLTDETGAAAVVLAWGPDSPPMREVEKQIAAEMMELASRSRGRPLKLDSEKYARKRFLARIDSWQNLTLGGMPFAYTAEAKATIWDDPKFGRIREMFETAVSDNSAFLAAKAT
jgi:hypothetical protein